MPQLPSEKPPEKLRPYIFHGLELEWYANSKDATGDCPFCSREKKFAVNLTDGTSNCVVCKSESDKGGYNTNTFLKRLHTDSEDETSVDDYKELADQRGVEFQETLISWKLCKSKLSTDWLVPGYERNNGSLELNQLYQYLDNYKGGRILFLTPTLGHRLFGLNLFDPKKSQIILCEGIWDAMVLWETLRRIKLNDDGTLGTTANVEKSLLDDINILAVPGCTTFFESWVSLFEGKSVTIAFDNDHPRIDHAVTREPAALMGAKRVTRILSQSPKPPADINVLQWSDSGYDENLKHGYDIRDLLNKNGKSITQRIPSVSEFFDLVVPVPEEWLKETKHQENHLNPQDCTTYEKVSDSWKIALQWTPNLDCTLSVMFAVAMSTKLKGVEQLWFLIEGPPSCGKTTLLEGLAVNKEAIYSKDTIRGFYSGWKSSDGEDYSIAAEANGKTLATKDGDTLLKAPNRAQILSEGRGLYDRCGRTHFKNETSKDYEGHSMTWLLCGTKALREIDDSELGARFLTCTVMDDIDLDHEKAASLISARQESNAMRGGSQRAEDCNKDALNDARELSGGYVEFLTKSPESLIEAIPVDEGAEDTMFEYGRFIAFLRARPSKEADDEPTREFAPRLTKQLTRLMYCIAAIRNKTKIDDEVLEIVYKVVMDTSRGQSLDIVRQLTDEPQGMPTKTLSVCTGFSDHKTNWMLRFLIKIGVVESIKHEEKTPKGIVIKLKNYKLTPFMQNLYDSVNQD